MSIDRTKLTYRQSVSGMCFNNNGQMLIIQKLSWKENEWDFPGGGIDSGETPKIAIIRELNEELGSDKFKILGKSKLIDRYEWPDEVIKMRRIKKNENYRGQERIQFLVKFEGKNDDIKIKTDELKDFKWIKITELEKYFVFPNQWKKAKELLKEFII